MMILFDSEFTWKVPATAPEFVSSLPARAELCGAAYKMLPTVDGDKSAEFSAGGNRCGQVVLQRSRRRCRHVAH
jgi:hypothetical protein